MVGVSSGGKSDSYAAESDGRHSSSWASTWKTYGVNSAMSLAKTCWNGGKSIASKASTAAGVAAQMYRTSDAIVSKR